MNKMILGAVCTLVVVAVIGFVVLNFTNIISMPTVETRTEVSAELLTATIQEISELATLSYNYRNVIIFQEQATIGLFGAQLGIPGTARSLIAVYNGQMRLGIDVARVAIDVSDTIITISLPNAEILNHTVDMDSIEVLNEDSGLFTSVVGIQEFADLVSEEMGTMEGQVLASPMLSEARTNAESIIRGLLEVFPEITDNYTIVFN